MAEVDTLEAFGNDLALYVKYLDGTVGGGNVALDGEGIGRKVVYGCGTGIEAYGSLHRTCKVGKGNLFGYIEVFACPSVVETEGHYLACLTGCGDIGTAIDKLTLTATLIAYERAYGVVGCTSMLNVPMMAIVLAKRLPS